MCVRGGGEGGHAGLLPNPARSLLTPQSLHLWRICERLRLRGQPGLIAMSRSALLCNIMPSAITLAALIMAAKTITVRILAL